MVCAPCRTPPEKKALEKISCQSTKSRAAGEQFLPLDCMAKARPKGVLFSQTPVARSPPDDPAPCRTPRDSWPCGTGATPIGIVVVIMRMMIILIITVIVAVVVVVVVVVVRMINNNNNNNNNNKHNPAPCRTPRDSWPSGTGATSAGARVLPARVLELTTCQYWTSLWWLTAFDIQHRKEMSSLNSIIAMSSNMRALPTRAENQRVTRC